MAKNTPTENLLEPLCVCELLEYADNNVFFCGSIYICIRNY